MLHATAPNLTSLPEPDSLDPDLGIELLDDMIEEGFWEGFVVGAGIGTAVAGGAIAIGIAT